MDKIRRDRFKKVAQKRTQKVLDALYYLSKCSVKVSYKYTPAQVEAIFETIRDEINRCEKHFKRFMPPEPFKLNKTTQTQERKDEKIVNNNLLD